MRECKYTIDIGEFENLNEQGHSIVRMLFDAFLGRTLLNSNYASAEWKTFRDLDASSFSSIFTNQRSSCLPANWLNLDKNGKTVTFGGIHSANDELKLLQNVVNSKVVKSKKAQLENPPTVALIGCGPSGIFFLHALQSMFENESNHQDSSRLKPQVVCFEASDNPGGLWKPSEPNIPDTDTDRSIYDDLWCNVPKETVEFHDYTYQEHFSGKETPVYLPRDDTHEYIIKRATKKDPDFFKRSQRSDCLSNHRYQIMFNTTVQNVNYNQQTGKFEVKYKRSSSSIGEECDSMMEQFDYCIWAAGQNGKPRIPRYLFNLLKTGGPPPDEESDKEDNNVDNSTPVPFKGVILHSSHMSKLMLQ